MERQTHTNGYIYTDIHTHIHAQQTLWPLFMDRFQPNQGYRTTMRKNLLLPM